jgi:ATP-dependent DNA ligase
MRLSSTGTGSKSTSRTSPSRSSPGGHDWTKRFKKVAEDAWHIGAGSTIIGGEIVVPAADGTTDFSVLQMS